MRIEALALFLSVAQHRSISHAARQHYISQQGASAMIKSLEQELEVALFDRTPTGLQLTDTGQSIAKEAAAVLAAYRRVQIAAALGADGLGDEPLTIVTMPFVTNRLDVLFSEYESMVGGARLRIVERSLFDIIETYEGDEAGALFLIALPSFMERMAHRVRDNFKPLVSCELMAACARSHPLADRDRVSVEELSRMALACYNEEFLNRIMRHIMRGRQPNVQLRTSNPAMIGRAVASGEMVTFTDSLSVFLDRPNPDTVVVPIDGAVAFNVGVLGVPERGSAAARFARFFERYLTTSCASYMARHLTDEGASALRGASCKADDPDAAPPAANGSSLCAKEVPV